MSRVPVTPQDFEIGQPLKWDIYDLHGQLVLARGAVIASDEEKAEILKRRRVRELDLRLEVPSADADDQQSQESRREVRILLDETRIQPGEAMQIQSSLDSTRFAVRLIGYHKGKSIVVTNPLQDGTPVYLKEGQAFIARIFSGKFVYAFPCTVLASAVKPYSYLHLSYPADVVGVNIRKGDRARLRAIAAFETDDGRRGAGIIVDLSCGGAFFLSKSPEIALGRSLVLKFKVVIGPVEYVLEVPGYVRSVRPNDEEQNLGNGFGIEFAGVSPEDNLVLSSFIFQQIAENRIS
jgi:c-di-GMP-binding flagellar brake protein YcgR